VERCIANTTVISNFSRVGRLDILEKVFTIVYITPEIYHEVIRGIREGYQFLDSVRQQITVSSGWLRIISFQSEKELKDYHQYQDKLDSGEASCLAIASNRNLLLLTDDRAAREIARSIKVELSGTIGILTLAVDREIITLEEADSLLTDMIKGNYRSPVKSISELITSLKG